MKTIKPYTYYLVRLGAEDDTYLAIVRTGSGKGMMAFKTGSIYGLILKSSQILAELNLDVLAVEMVGWDTEMETV